MVSEPVARYQEAVADTLRAVGMLDALGPRPVFSGLWLRAYTPEPLPAFKATEALIPVLSPFSTKEDRRIFLEKKGYIPEGSPLRLLEIFARWEPGTPEARGAVYLKIPASKRFEYLLSPPPVKWEMLSLEATYEAKDFVFELGPAFPDARLYDLACLDAIHGSRVPRRGFLRLWSRYTTPGCSGAIRYPDGGALVLPERKKGHERMAAARRFTALRRQEIERILRYEDTCTH